MYNKILVSDVFSSPTKWDFKWFTARRSSVAIDEHSLSFGGKRFDFAAMQEVFLVRYKTLFVFDYYIFGFKYEGKYYQIGLSTRQKEQLQKKLQVEEQFQNTLLGDVLFVVVILTLIYITQVKLF
ncbi:MAG: hypothetical protein Q4B43_07055 [Bacteroidota bacterium]|nr:hypothetical protein [Bacteroidota bacterium]